MILFKMQTMDFCSCSPRTALFLPAVPMKKDTAFSFLPPNHRPLQRILNEHKSAYFVEILTSFNHVPQIFFQMSENTCGRFEETARTYSRCVLKAEHGQGSDVSRDVYSLPHGCAGEGCYCMCWFVKYVKHCRIFGDGVARQRQAKKLRGTR